MGWVTLRVAVNIVDVAAQVIDGGPGGLRNNAYRRKPMASGEPRLEGHDDYLLGDLAGSGEVIDGTTTADQVGFTGCESVVFIMTNIACGICGMTLVSVGIHECDVSEVRG